MDEFSIGQRVMVSPDTDKELLAGCMGVVTKLCDDYCVVAVEDFNAHAWSFFYGELLPTAILYADRQSNYLISSKQGW